MPAWYYGGGGRDSVARDRPRGHHVTAPRPTHDFSRMSRIFVHGWGAVSPAGWGCDSLVNALAAETPWPEVSLPGPPGSQLPARRVPPITPRPVWLAQSRLRRSSAISQFTVGAALEALAQAEAVAGAPIDRERLGIVCSVYGGSVIYSRRFFEEVLQNPALASPLLFPETVFNAPSSHLSAVLGSTAPNHTVLGDQTGFLQALAVAADWLIDRRIDACLVVGAEEWDWSTTVAARLYDRAASLSEGAGALVLRREPGPVELKGISSPIPFVPGIDRPAAAARVQAELSDTFPETDFPSLRTKRVLGEGLAATAAWECVAQVAGIAGTSATRSVVIAGANLQALGVTFGRTKPA